MTNLIKLPTFDDEGALQVVVESPRGSVLKFEYSDTAHAFTSGAVASTWPGLSIRLGFLTESKAEELICRTVLMNRRRLLLAFFITTLRA